MEKQLPPPLNINSLQQANTEASDRSADDNTSEADREDDSVPKNACCYLSLLVGNKNWQPTGQQIRLSVKVTNELNKRKVPKYRPPISKHSKQYLARRNKLYLGKNVPKNSTVSDEKINLAFTEYYKGNKSKSEICAEYFGRTPSGKPKMVTSFSSWIKNGYTCAAHIPRTGPKPILGVIGEARLMGYVGQRAELNTAMDDDEVAWKAAEAARALDLSEQQFFSKKYTRSKQLKYLALKSKPQVTTIARLRCNVDNALIEAHRIFGGFLEKHGLKEPGGEIYPSMLRHVWVGDEIGGKKTTGMCIATHCS